MSHTNDLAFQGHKSLENTARLCFTVKTLLPLLCPSALLLVLVGLFRFSLYQVPPSGRALCPGHGRTAGDSPRPKASGRARRAGALRRRRPLRAGASKATRLFPFSFWKFSQQITSTRKGNGVRFSRIHRVPLRDRAPDRTPGGANVDAEGGAALARARSRAGGACAHAPARHTRCDPCSVPGFRFATSG